MWDKFFAVFINFLIFFHPIFHAFLSLRGIEQESGQKQYFNIALSVYAWIMFIHYYIIGKERITKFHRRLLSSAVIVGVCYWLTGQYLSGSPHGYNASFLGWGSAGISGMLAGMMIMDNKRITEVSRLIPYFSIATTLIITAFTFVAGEVVKNDNEFGWDYQVISYYMADCFLLNAYFLLFFKDRKRNLYQKIINFAVVITMFLDAFQVYNSGGRGGAVLQTFAIIYILWYLYKNKYISNYHLFLIVLVSIIVFFIIANKMNLWDSAGMGRITNSDSKGFDGRLELYDSAINYWMKSPIIGYGLGSIWYTVGFYSHNFFTDVLAEGGMIGFLIMITILFKALVRVYRFSIADQKLVLVMFYSFTGLIMLLFSTYWFDNEQFWFLMGAVWSVDCQKVLKNGLNYEKGYYIRNV